MSGHRKEPPRSGAFDIGAGWYAQPNQDGSVTLWSGAGQEETTIPAKTWIRLIASLSRGGYSDASHTAALALHQGG